MKRLLRLALYLPLPVLSLAAGYRFTEHWFREKFIRYPFELYGLAVGLALFFWTIAVLMLADKLISKFFAKKKPSKPYVVKVENRISEVELFK